MQDQNKTTTEIDTVVTEPKDPAEEETDPEVDSFEEWEEVSKNITIGNDTKLNETDVVNGTDFVNDTAIEKLNHTNHDHQNKTCINGTCIANTTCIVDEPYCPSDCN